MKLKYNFLNIKVLNIFNDLIEMPAKFIDFLITFDCISFVEIIIIKNYFNRTGYFKQIFNH